MSCADRKAAYDILGVRPTDDAEAIRRAWRRLVRTYHPDTFAGDKDAANAMLVRLNAAFDALKDQIDPAAPMPPARGREAALAARREAARQRAMAAEAAAEAARATAAKRAAAAIRRAEAARTVDAEAARRDAALRAALRPERPPALTEEDRRAALGARRSFAAARRMFATRERRKSPHYA